MKGIALKSADEVAHRRATCDAGPRSKAIEIALLRNEIQVVSYGGRFNTKTHIRLPAGYCCCHCIVSEFFMGVTRNMFRLQPVSS